VAETGRVNEGPDGALGLARSKCFDLSTPSRHDRQGEAATWLRESRACLYDSICELNT